MRKSIVLILLINLVNGFVSNAQIETTNEVIEVEQKLIGNWKETMVFSNTKIGIGYKTTYTFLDTKNNTKKEVKCLPDIETSEIISNEMNKVYGQYIYEVFSFQDKKRNLRAGLTKRDIETGMQVGEILFLEHEGYAIEFFNDREGIHLMIGTSLYRLDYDLNMIWQQSIKEFCSENNTVSSTSVDEDNNFLVSILIKEEVKSKFFGNSPIRKSGLAFVVIDNEGEMQAVIPEIPSNITFTASKFKFYPEKKELVGILMITEIENERTMETKGMGYQYIRWNSEGEILASKKHMFKPSEFESEELTMYTNISGFNYTKYFKNDEFKQVSLFDINYVFQKNGDVIVASSGFNCVFEDVGSSKIIFSITSNGEMNWLRFIPYPSNINYRGIKNGVYSENNRLHYIIKEFSANFENGDYKLKTIRGVQTPESVQFCDLIIDCLTGKTISYKPILNSTIPKFIPNEVAFNNDVDQLILKYSYTIKNLQKYAIINF